MNADLLKIPNLPGTWQYWSSEERDTVWVVPADEKARNFEGNRFYRPQNGFVKIPRTALYSSSVDAEEASLF